MPSRLAVALLLVAALPSLSPPRAGAQVVVIDPDAVAPVVAGPAAPLAPMRFTVALLRFVPVGKAVKSPPPIPTNGSPAEIAIVLGKQGSVNLLYLGDRDQADSSGAIVRFDSVERRPAFSLDASANHSLTNREFGLHLSVAAAPAGVNQLKVKWDGGFSWSPDLIDAWAGEKYLVFGMRIVGVLKPGAVYTDSDDDDDSGRGINIGGLFKKKPKETKPAKSAVDISFLAAEREEVVLKGTCVARPGQVNVTFVPAANTDEKHPEYLYLIQQFDWVD